MNYISTRNNSKEFTFENVFIKGLAEDGGLFVPKSIKKIETQQLNELSKKNYKELATEIIFKFTGEFINKSDLSNLINKSYSEFSENDVVKISHLRDYKLLELFHGPTLAFKDIAMQFIGNLYEYYLSKINKDINIVVATSGDTGAAAIDAIKGKSNMNIFVLHPNNKISNVQRKLMTTVREKNVFNIAVEGNFDDCQNLVKSMFSDLNFSKSINMSGVNSINWARIIAQSVYYFYSYFKINQNEELNFSVPTGNFGDVYAGYLAKKMGLPINKLVVATNQNDILHRAIEKGDYKSKKVKETSSPSMDIQLASNFERLIYDIEECDSNKTKEIMNKIKNNQYQIDRLSLDKIKKNFISESLNEKETLETIKHVYQNDRVIIDPHTAVGVGAARKLNLKKNCVVLATAHPCKFPIAIEKAINKKSQLPSKLNYILSEKENFDIVPNELEKIKRYILDKLN